MYLEIHRRKIMIPLQRILVALNNKGNFLILDSEGIDAQSKRDFDFRSVAGDLDFSHPSSEESFFQFGLYVWEGVVRPRNFDTPNWQGKWRFANCDEVECWHRTGTLLPIINTVEEAIEYLNLKDEIPKLITFTEEIFGLTPKLIYEKQYPIKVIFRIEIPPNSSIKKISDSQSAWYEKVAKENFDVFSIGLEEIFT